MCAGAAELMQAAAEKADTSMAAVVKLDNEKVRELCSKYSAVYPVNYQLSRAGFSRGTALGNGSVRCGCEGRGRQSHSAQGFGRLPFSLYAGGIRRLCRGTFGDALSKRGEVVLYSNKTAEPYGEDAARLLAEQICSPVRWEETIRHMTASGIDTFVEVGPGKTLANMMKKIDAQARVYAVCELPVLLSEVAKC